MPPIASARVESEPLKRSALVALKWGYFGQVVRSGCGFIIGVVLARLLGPKPFGEVTIACLVIGLGSLMADFGLGSALIQKKEVLAEEIRFAFSVQVIMGALLSLVGALCAGLIAAAFHQPGATPVIRALMSVFFLQSIGQTASSLLMRRLAFKEVQIAQITSYLVGYVLIGIPLAYIGWGVWALVAAQIAQTVLNAIMLYVRCCHSISPLLSLRCGAIISFGGCVTLSNLLNWAVSNLDNAFVGRSFGVSDLGLYNRAFTLVATPMNTSVMALQSVLFSASSRAQENHKALKRVYLAAVAIISTLLLPVFATIAVIPKTVIIGLYGEKWAAAAPILTPLALAMPFNALLALSGPILWGMGRVNRSLRAQFITVMASVVVFTITSRMNVVFLSWGVFFVYVLWFALITQAAAESLRITVADIARCVRGPVVVAATAAAMALGIANYLQPMSAPPRLVAAGVVVGAVVALAFRLAPARLLSVEAIATLDSLRASLPRFLSRALPSVTTQPEG